MLLLVIDTSTPAVSAGLARVDAGGVELLAEKTTVDGRAHGERLAPAVAEIIRPFGLAEIAAVVAGLGPGPFTGLRVGLVTAATIAQARGIPTYGVCSLDAIGRGSRGDVLVASDARRKEIYWARYADGERASEPAVGRASDVAAMLAAPPDAVIGEGARLYQDALGLTARPPWYPSLRALAELAADRARNAAPSETLTPLYLRRPDAVEPAGRKAVLP